MTAGRTTTIAVPGARLAVEESGPSDAVSALLIHAGVTDRRSWSGLTEVLDPTIRSIRYDARGYGATVTEEHDGWSPVADARAVLDAAALDTAIVIGCSMGGRTAIDLALVSPQRVRALVLIAPAISGAPAPVLDEITTELDRRGDEALDRGDLATVNRIEAELWLDGPGRTGRVGDGPRRLFLAMNGDALAAGTPGTKAQDAVAWDRLGEIRVPTLVLVGSLDLSHVRAAARHAAATIPGAEFVELEDAAHLPHVEGHAAALSAIAGFVNRLAQD
ncbi:alpha/beta fold hydrolase [Microbacterium sp. NPDC056052]|uniref:alpha/beta fold hydrolase n=1 Tax=Microbacterium sp. NPDC056052 TaxID=3345695 RepID=UPI0035DF8054